MSTATRIITAEELLLHPPRNRCELVKGELRTMSPAGSEHGWIIARLTARLGTFVDGCRCGFVFGAETGFLIAQDPDTVRAPDVAFVRSDRITGVPPPTFFPGAPDIAVEVLSPGDSASEVEEKAEDWLLSGCAEVWLIDPRRKIAVKCTRSDNAILHQTVEILGSDLLPGFELRVADLFAG